MSTQNTFVPETLANTVKWLKLFEEKLARKYSILSNGNREKFWKFLVKSIDKTQLAADPVSKLVAIVGVAAHANCAMLPPKAHARMWKKIGSELDINVVSSDPSNYDCWVKDEKIPQAVASCIDQFPRTLTLSEEVRSYLLIHVYMKLKYENNHISNWVHKGGELDYWQHDFDDLAEEFATKLGMNSAEREMIEEELTLKRQSRERGYNASFMRILKSFQSGNIPTF
mmetsp:Transcript_22855/g.33894  ORF Transcript_22855/g.33894 Transcript_22855/m.33894 type:complete len:227 (-) Transcript_22855:144-824(-)